MVEEWLQGVGRSGIVSCAQTTLGWRCPVRLSMSGGPVSLAVVVSPGLSVVRQWVEATAQLLAVLCGGCCRGLPLLPVCVLSVVRHWLDATVRHPAAAVVV